MHWFPIHCFWINGKLSNWNIYQKSKRPNLPKKSWSLLHAFVRWRMKSECARSKFNFLNRLKVEKGKNVQHNRNRIGMHAMQNKVQKKKPFPLRVHFWHNDKLHSSLKLHFKLCECFFFGVLFTNFTLEQLWNFRQKYETIRSILHAQIDFNRRNIQKCPTPFPVLDTRCLLWTQTTTGYCSDVQRKWMTFRRKCFKLFSFRSCSLNCNV